MARAHKAADTGLTAKQENFCLIYFELGNGAEAYRQSYDAGKMKPASIYTEVHKLLNDPKITHRLNGLRHTMRERTVVSQEDHLVELERLRNNAVASGEIGHAIRAEKARGEVLGYYVKKTELAPPGAFKKLRTKEELRQAIKERSVKLGTAKVIPLTRAKRKAA